MINAYFNNFFDEEEEQTVPSTDNNHLTLFDEEFSILGPEKTNNRQFEAVVEEDYNDNLIDAEVLDMFDRFEVYVDRLENKEADTEDIQYEDLEGEGYYFEEEDKQYYYASDEDEYMCECGNEECVCAVFIIPSAERDGINELTHHPDL
ncbi:hypothetical protein ABG067_007667 [Albugo candida]